VVDLVDIDLYLRRVGRIVGRILSLRFVVLEPVQDRLCGVFCIKPQRAALQGKGGTVVFNRRSKSTQQTSDDHDIATDRFTASLPTWAKIVVPMLLGISAILNITALMPGIPFLKIESVLMSSLAGDYSILKVVQLLWTYDLYPLVVLVVCFSILFPPLKIILASVCLYRPMPRRGRERLLSLLGHLGRWSLLDVFVSLILLLVLSKETFVGVGVQYGLYCFLIAIILSMTAGLILHEFSRRANPRETYSTDKIRPLIMYAGWQGVVATILASIAIVVITFAFFRPMFQVDKFGLVSNIWSLRDGIAFLFTDELQLFAIVMFLFLVVAPILVMLMLLVSLYVPLPHQWRRRCYLIMRYVAEWSMLDVFSLALVMYLSEQSNFVPLIILRGTWLLFGSVVVFTGATLWAEYAMRRAILRRDAAGGAAVRLPGLSP
jgi:uncharacterized paraquat-inducible protein A